ncbi:hypothetical protein [Paraburkholderia pallida]|nr:hypothetical protein [Paraburkholderia pallida]
MTAIPPLLDAQLLKGGGVTNDVTGCQMDIAQKLVDAGVHY